MRERVEEGLDGLPSQRATAQIRYRSRDHHWKPRMALKITRNGKDGRLGIERVKNCLHQKNICPTRNEVYNLLGVGSGDLLKSDLSLAGIVHIP